MQRLKEAVGLGGGTTEAEGAPGKLWQGCSRVGEGWISALWTPGNSCLSWRPRPRGGMVRRWGALDGGPRQRRREGSAAADSAAVTLSSCCPAYPPARRPPMVATLSFTSALPAWPAEKGVAAEPAGEGAEEPRRMETTKAMKPQPQVGGGCEAQGMAAIERLAGRRCWAAHCQLAGALPLQPPPRWYLGSAALC